MRDGKPGVGTARMLAGSPGRLMGTKGALQSCRAASWWDAEAERGAANPAGHPLGGMLGLGKSTSPAGQPPGGMLGMGRQGGDTLQLRRAASW